eukprot:1514992-Amphidinium_carterae.1
MLLKSFLGEVVLAPKPAEDAPETNVCECPLWLPLEQEHKSCDDTLCTETSSTECARSHST